MVGQGRWCEVVVRHERAGPEALDVRGHAELARSARSRPGRRRTGERCGDDRRPDRSRSRASTRVEDPPRRLAVRVVVARQAERVESDRRLTDGVRSMKDVCMPSTMILTVSARMRDASAQASRSRRWPADRGSGPARGPGPTRGRRDPALPGAGGQQAPVRRIWSSCQGRSRRVASWTEVMPMDSRYSLARRRVAVTGSSVGSGGAYAGRADGLLLEHPRGLTTCVPPKKPCAGSGVSRTIPATARTSELTHAPWQS